MAKRKGTPPRRRAEQAKKYVNDAHKIAKGDWAGTLKELRDSIKMEAPEEIEEKGRRKSRRKFGNDSSSEDEEEEPPHIDPWSAFLTLEPDVCEWLPLLVGALPPPPNES